MDITPETPNLYWHQTITALWKLNWGWGDTEKTQFTAINIMLIACMSQTHWSRNHCFIPGIECKNGALSSSAAVGRE